MARIWNQSRQYNYGEMSDYSVNAAIWNKFWKTRIPNRVKLVTWCLLHNSLPVFSNLEKRGCNVSNECGFRGFKKEDATHLFMDCSWPRCLWKLLGLEKKVWQNAVN